MDLFPNHHKIEVQQFGEYAMVTAKLHICQPIWMAFNKFYHGQTIYSWFDYLIARGDN